MSCSVCGSVTAPWLGLHGNHAKPFSGHVLITGTELLCVGGITNGLFAPQRLGSSSAELGVFPWQGHPGPIINILTPDV